LFFFFLMAAVLVTLIYIAIKNVQKYGFKKKA